MTRRSGRKSATGTNDLLSLLAKAGRAIVETGAVIACPLLGTDKFVKFCKDRGLAINRERLLRLERLGLFAPIFRVRTPASKHAPPFSLPPRKENNWFTKRWAWDTTAIGAPHAVPHHSDRTQEGYYSVFQLDHLDLVLSAMTFSIFMDGFLKAEAEDVDWAQQGGRWLNDARDSAASLRTHEFRRSIGLLCQFISNRYPTTSYAKNALVQPESREMFRQILDQGWVDAIRTLHPDAPMYTFWDYMRNRWQRDAGLRIDHLLLSKEASSRLSEAGVDRDVRGVENASDHAPAWIVLRDDTTQRSRRGAASRAGKPRRSKAPAATPSRPLLVIDGDSFAHRFYHALPKTIRRRDGKLAGAILGFANFLLRLYRDEQPRAVLVAWDTLDVPTYRHTSFPDYQSGREFDEELLEQLTCPFCLFHPP